MPQYLLKSDDHVVVVSSPSSESTMRDLYGDCYIAKLDQYGNIVPGPQSDVTPEQCGIYLNTNIGEPTPEASNVIDFDEQLGNLVNFFGKEWCGGLTGTQYQFKKSTTEEDTVANPQPVEETIMKPERFTPITSIESVEYYIRLAIEATAELIPLTVTGVQGMLDIALKEPFTLPPTFNAKFYSEYYVDQAAYGRNVALYNLIMKTIELREDIQRQHREETLAETSPSDGVSKLVWDNVFNPHFPNEFPPTRLDTRVSDSMAKHEGRKVVTSALNDWKRRVDMHYAISSDLTQEQTILQEAQFKHLKRYVKGLVKSILENTEDALIVIDVAEKDSFGFITGSSDGKSHTRHFTVKYYKNNWIILEA